MIVHLKGFLLTEHLKTEAFSRISSRPAARRRYSENQSYNLSTPKSALCRLKARANQKTLQLKVR